MRILTRTLSKNPFENNIKDKIMGQESEEEAEDMDIEELDLEGIEKECTEKEKGIEMQEQVSLLKESILKSRASNLLGINLGSHKEKKKKAEEQGRKTDRKTIKHGVANVGRRLVESRQYLTIKSSLGL